MVIGGRQSRCACYLRKVGCEFETRLVVLSCSNPSEIMRPDRFRHMADRAVKLGYIDSLLYETVLCVLKNDMNPW